MWWIFFAIGLALGVLGGVVLILWRRVRILWWIAQMHAETLANHNAAIAQLMGGREYREFVKHSNGEHHHHEPPTN